MHSNHIFLKSSPLFSALSDEKIESLLEQANIIKCTKGRVLFLSDEPATHFYFLKFGWIKLFRETLDGAESIVDVLNDGHIFGESAMFSEDLYTYGAEAVEPSEVISLPLSMIKNELDTNLYFAKSFIRFLSDSRDNKEHEIEHRSLQTAPQRIGCFLLRLTDQKKKGPLTIHLPYDKTLVAKRLGMQPETFSRALTKLREETGIRIKGSTVEMDSITQLQEFTCSACSSGFPCRDLAKKGTCVGEHH